MSRHTKVILSDAERSHLDNMIRSGSAPVRVQTRVRILLLTDRSQGQSLKDDEVARAVMMGRKTIERIRARYLAEGLDSALYDKPRPGQPPKITGDVEAQLVVLACSDPPEGRNRWTLQMLADKLVELELVESITSVAVHKRLKKTFSNRGG